MAETTINVFDNKSEGTVTVASGSGILIVEKTQAQYDALTTKDANTLYLITSSGSSS